METILYLIRHGETGWNRLKRIQGHSDLPLTAVGERQADCLAARFAGRPLSIVYSSDLKRAYETARRLADMAGLEVRTTPDLRERNYGEWEGLTYQEIEERYGTAVRDEAKYGIEPFEAMQRRAKTCLTSIAENHPDQMVAVVSHGGLINAFLHLVTDGVQGTGVTRIENTGITTFRYRSGQWDVLQVNDIGHLQEPPLTAG
ncbi:MAG: histidine phosphatase family protein [Brevibacillus sp.]|nr:histidine phosphatase family protein [Brevibacillus sp.]